jgi:serine/threonine protein phosphatase PrpC
VDLGFAVGLTRNGGRQYNEDAFLIYRDPVTKEVFVLLADGMGGHALGEKASAAATLAAFRQLLTPHRLLMPEEELMQNAFHAAYGAVAKTGQSLDKSYGGRLSLGTTLNIAFARRGQLQEYAHIGDSRIYAADRGSKTPYLLTRDHALVLSEVFIEHILITRTRMSADERRRFIELSRRHPLSGAELLEFERRYAAVPLRNILHRSVVWYSPDTIEATAEERKEGSPDIGCGTALPLNWVLLESDGPSDCLPEGLSPVLARALEQCSTIQEALAFINGEVVKTEAALLATTGKATDNMTLVLLDLAQV